MHESQSDTDQLLKLACAGDQSATQELLDRFRPRLRGMVAMHLDRRLSARIDPSDVVQEALADAFQRLPEYANSRTISFYPWLRQIAWQRLVKLHRKHLITVRRSVKREDQPEITLPDDSVQRLVDKFVSSGDGPFQRLLAKELQERVRTALDDLRHTDREILVMRYLEHMSITEISETLDEKLTTVKKRHTRALERLQRILGDNS